MSDSPAMISPPRLCPKCGSEIPADAPEKGCPGCLLENGLGPLPDAQVTARDASTITGAAVDNGGSAENVEVNTAAAADHSKKSKALCRDTGGTGRLRITGSGRSRRSGCGLPGASEESQSHSGAQDDKPGLLGHRSAPEAFSPGGRSCRWSRTSGDCAHL